MKNSQRGIAPLLIVLIVAIIVVGGGAYYVSTKSDAGNSENEALISNENVQRSGSNGDNDSVASETKNNSVTSGAQFFCGLTLKVDGALFSPNKCQFEIVTPDVACDRDGQKVACESDIILTLQDTTITSINKTHARYVNLYLKKIEKGTYVFKANDSSSSLTGDLLDKDLTNRNLQVGTLTIGSGTSSVQVSFNLTFANNIKVQGAGTLQVVGRSNP